MSLIPYLYFQGECEQAFDFYKSVFSGEYLVQSRYQDGPPELNFEAEDGQRVMHCTLKIGDSVIHGADVPPTREGFEKGTNIAISYAPQSRKTADEMFAALTKGGQVTMPLQDTFWGSYFGTCTDKFGIQWLFNFANPGSE